MDLDGGFAGAPASGADEKSPALKEARWASTSSVESELDSFWHDSTALSQFYTTQDTVNTLDSFDFNHDSLFSGSFDSCSNSLLQHRTQDSLNHVTETSSAGIESIDFASAHMNSEFSRGLDSIVSDAPDMADYTALDTWSMPVVSIDHSSTLKDRLSFALAQGDSGRLFLPDSSLRTILSHQAISVELRRYLPLMPVGEMDRLVGQIMPQSSVDSVLSTGLLRTFAALVMSDKAESIVDLLHEGLSDAALPLTKVRAANSSSAGPTFNLRRKDATGVELRCFRNWSQADLCAFEKAQWKVLSPVFSDVTKEEDVDFHDLEDQVVLPYVESWENKKQDHYKGGNSEVWKVKIHDAHHRFKEFNSAIPNNPYFAIKKLKSKDEDAFHREVRNLQRLHNAEHPNLLSLLATYKFKGYYHLVFPWADGDLRRLWQSTPNPQAGKEEMRWLASQCANIASALKSVHAGAESWMNGANGGGGPSGQQRMAMNKFGIHGDIKPENIFIFKSRALAMGPPNRADSAMSSERSSRSASPSSVADEFVIGDFGGGEFFDPSRNPDPLRQITVTYRPPEYDTKLQPVSRSWDVWGLGCTYLEFVTWFLLGPTGLKEFAKRRTTRTAAGKLSDEYFETFVDESQTGGIGATLKESVLSWIGELYRHESSSPFIRDFLDFITHRMFIVEGAQITRASGAEVADYMDSLTQKCFDNDAYCVSSPSTASPWEVENIDSSITALSSTTPDDLTLDFIATTEDVSAPISSWNFSMDMINPVNVQWNTAPIIPSPPLANNLGVDVLESWNYTAPVAWNCNDNASPTDSIGSKRKRELEGPGVSKRRMSQRPSTSISRTETSPSNGSSSSTVEDSSPAEFVAAKAAEKRLACPYYKNNPGKFRQKRTCCGPGWPTVHRVKEHLYRCHTIGKHTCSRCLKRCKSAAELLAHQRAAVPCETRTDAFPEGTMTPSQEETLRMKKRVPPNTTEEQRWNEVYMVLFPDAQADVLPTPFYDDEPTESKSAGDAPCSSKDRDDETTAEKAWFCSPADYEAYLTRSLPQRVQRDLARQIQREFGFVGSDSQTGTIINMVQKLQLSMFRQFEQERRRDPALRRIGGGEAGGGDGDGGGGS